MKPSILIASYLWKDTWSRWREQPSSVLARLFVGGMLVLVATVILVAFQLMERGLKERLERFGLNTLIVREVVSANDPELIAHVSRADRLGALDASGTHFRLRQLMLRAHAEWQNDLLVFTYPPEAMPALAPWLDAGEPFIWFTDRVPPGIRARFVLNRQSSTAVTRRAPEFLRMLTAEGFLLAPQGWGMDAERLGYVETTLLQKTDEGMSMDHVVRAVQTVYALDRRTQPQLQSPLALSRELEELQQRQRSWRALLAGILGFTLALVFGTIAVLEFRQNLYVTALLRSLGTPARFLYIRQLVENACVANAAALAAIAMVALLHDWIFGTLGFVRSGGAGSGAGWKDVYLGSEVLFILLWVNVGAVLSSLPVAFGLRRPVGVVLN